MAGEEGTGLLELEVGSVAGGGSCVARTPDGKVVFVRHALPGERVRALVTAVTSSFLRADAVEVLDPSPDRVRPPCPHAGPGRCGGCDYQHVAPAAQRRLKATRLAEQLARLAGTDRTVEVEAVPGDREGLGWRSRVSLAVAPDGTPGFRRHRSHRLEPVDDCPVASPAVGATGALRARWPGVSRIEVVTPTGTSTLGGPGPGDAVAPGEAVITVAPRGRAVPPLPDVRAGLVVRGSVRRPPGAVHATVAGRTYRISAGVFWQVHVGAAEALLAVVLDLVGDCRGAHVVDLYAGAGLFSVPLAAAVGPGGSVLAVERDARACADTRHNGAGAGPLRVLRRDIGPGLVAAGIGRPEVVVLDPSRQGVGTAVMGALASHAGTLRTLVYVSCDPATFARDARVLLDAGWQLRSLRAFDIFPMTEHLELVAGFAPPEGSAQQA